MTCDPLSAVVLIYTHGRDELLLFFSLLIAIDEEAADSESTTTKAKMRGRGSRTLGFFVCSI